MTYEKANAAVHCIRCSVFFPGSFSGECPECEAAVLREWVATEECKSEIKRIPLAA